MPYKKMSIEDTTSFPFILNLTSNALVPAYKCRLRQI